MPDDQDPRDWRRPRRAPTSPTGVPEPIERELTPVSGDPLVMLSFRAKRQSEALGEVKVRVAGLEQGVSQCRVDIASTQAALTGLDEKVDELVKEARASAQERIDREKRIETRAEAELDRRAKRNLSVIAIVVPTVTALAAGIAAVVAAINASGH